MKRIILITLNDLEITAYIDSDAISDDKKTLVYAQNRVCLAVKTDIESGYPVYKQVSPTNDLLTIFN